MITGNFFWDNWFGGGKSTENIQIEVTEGSQGENFPEGGGGEELGGGEGGFLPPGKWELAWSDEFDGQEINYNWWSIRTGERRDGWLSWG